MVWSRRLVCGLMVFAMVGHRWTAPADGARILAVETIGARSHWNFMSAVLRSLAGAGHAVTVLTPLSDSDDATAANLTVVDTSADNTLEIDRDLIPLLDEFGNPFWAVGKMNAVNRLFCDMTYGSDRLKEILVAGGGADGRFDLFIVEPVAYDCMSHIAVTLHVPVVYVIPSPMITSFERDFTGHVSNPACVSHIMAPHAVPKTFFHRLYNTALLAYNVLRTNYDVRMIKYTDPRPYDQSPAVSPSMIFQNTHYITEASRPVAPNVIDVGGIHLKPAKTIPKVSFRCRFTSYIIHRNTHSNPLTIQTDQLNSLRYIDK